MMFDDYYRRLVEYYRKTPPEDFAILEDWGMMALNSQLNEGLITTYPRERVVKYLRKIGVVNMSEDEAVPNQNRKSNTIVIGVPPNLQVIPNLIERLNKGLYVYGWKVSGEPKKDELTIEPIFSYEVVPDKADNFYHITHEMFVPKIKKVGLLPRETTTLFEHPGSRIYLIQTNDDVPKKSLANLLIASRLRKKNYPKVWADEWVADNMVAINVNVEGLKLFEDPMSPSKKGTFKAFFTQQNIHPDRILEIRHLND